MAVRRIYIKKTSIQTGAIFSEMINYLTSTQSKTVTSKRNQNTADMILYIAFCLASREAKR